MAVAGMVAEKRLSLPENTSLAVSAGACQEAPL
jgi:hypothetical protein